MTRIERPAVKAALRLLRRDRAIVVRSYTVARRGVLDPAVKREVAEYSRVIRRLEKALEEA